uniref:Uncharacterized protein n=1 Tax=Clytia hemisphaerica TaxID=252671 RepID=A0A7M5VH91_9CNID
MGEKKVKEQLSILQYSFAGALSGVVSRFLGQPLDVIKIRLQLQNKEAGQLKYTGVLNTCKLIFKEEGLFGFWKGHVPAQVLSIFYGSVQFASFERSRSFLNPYLCQRKELNDFLSGGNAGIVSSLFVHPLDLLRTRAVSNQAKQSLSLHILIKSTAQESGIRTFYQGIIPNLAYVYPYCGLNFLFYGLLNRTWNLLQFRESSVKSLACGTISGIFAKALLLPIDNVKKRLQVQGSKDFQSSYKGMVNCLQSVIREQGIHALYRGIVPSVLKG